jgi:hypothetical protein
LGVVGEKPELLLIHLKLYNLQKLSDASIVKSLDHLEYVPIKLEDLQPVASATMGHLKQALNWWT